jgi:poly-gamma-glutamate synthesis protein (capsule biosynthesis protein)
MANLKIALIGDVMCGDSFHAVGHGVSSALDEYGLDFLPPPIVESFHRKDMVLFNMESVLSDVGRRDHSLRKLHMRGRPQAASYLAQWGLTCANVANNHILEQGRDCAVDTVRHLEHAGICVVGGGRDGLFESGLQVADLEIRGQCISVLGLCLLDEKYVYAGGREFEHVVETIRSLSRDGRTVIVSVHWGRELMDRPTARQRRMASEMIDAGASVIAGHHPHVVQGVQCEQGRLVAYSLGNFLFDQFLADCCWSMVVTIELAGRNVVKWDCLPIVKDEVHRPMFAQGREKARLQAEVQRRCDLLTDMPDSAEEQECYAAEFARADAAARRALWIRLLKTLPEKKPVFWPQLLLRPIQRRSGRW